MAAAAPSRSTRKRSRRWASPPRRARAARAPSPRSPGRTTRSRARDGDVDRGSERRLRADERELVIALPQAERHGDVAERRIHARGRVAARIGRELVVEGCERRVAAADGIAREALEQVRAPLGRLRIRGASPSGCRLSRSTLTGGSSRCPRTPSSQARRAHGWPRRAPSGGRRRAPGRARGRAAPARSPRAPAPSPARRGRAARTRARSRRRAAGGCARAAEPRAARRGAAPSRALGRARPVSTKLRWRAETPASSARSNWLSRRRCRHSRSSAPTGGRLAATLMSRS